MAALILLYAYTLAVICTLVGLSFWAARNKESGVQAACGASALALNYLALVGLTGLPFDYLKVISIACVLPLSLAGVTLTLSGLIGIVASRTRVLG